MGFHPIQGLTATARYLGGYGTPTTVLPPKAGVSPFPAADGRQTEDRLRVDIEPKSVATPYQSVVKCLGDATKFKVPFTDKEILPQWSGLGMAAIQTVGMMGIGAGISYLAKTPYAAIQTLGVIPKQIDSTAYSNPLSDAVLRILGDPTFFYPMFGIMAGAGLYQFGKHLGKVIYPTEGAPSHVSVQRSVAWTAAFAGLWGAVRFLGDTTGVHQFMPNGSDFLFGGWMDRITTGTMDFNFNLYAAYWTTFITGAFVTNVMASLANTVPQIGYVAAAVFENAATGQSRLFKYFENRTFNENHTKISPDGTEELIKTIPAVAAQDRVIPEVQQYRGAESSSIKDGKYTNEWMTKYVWRTAFIGAGVFLGAESADHVQQLISNSSTDSIWSGIVGGGGGLLSLGLLLSEFETAQKYIPGVKSVAAFKSAMASLFNAERLPYYGVYTLFGGVLTGGTNVFSGMLQGLDNTDNYFAKTFFRGFYSPYLNRIVLAVRLGRGERNLSMFSVIFPGFLMVMGLVEAQSQSAQALPHLYDSAAAAYEVSYTDEARAAALQEMNYYEDLVETCIKNDCYGREDTLALAKETWVKIEARKQSLGLPL